MGNFLAGVLPSLKTFTYVPQNHARYERDPHLYEEIEGSDGMNNEQGQSGLSQETLLRSRKKWWVPLVRWTSKVMRGYQLTENPSWNFPRVQILHNTHATGAALHIYHPQNRYCKPITSWVVAFYRSFWSASPWVRVSLLRRIKEKCSTELWGVFGARGGKKLIQPIHFSRERITRKRVNE